MILLYLIQKELLQMMRNIILPIVFILLPLGLSNMIPRLASQEVKNVKFAVVDNDHTTTSSRLVQRLDASTYLDLAYYANSYKDAMQKISSGEVDAIVEIRDGQLQISANSVNGTKGSMASMYITAIANDPQLSALTSSLSARFLFNPTLEYKVYMIPAIFMMLMILIVGFLPALNIVSEKEKGTIEQINVSPIRRVDFILSKIIPYVFVGVLMILEALLATKVFYGITSAGSIPLLLFVTLLVSMLISSVGLIISNYSSTLRQAALAMFFFLIIFMLMSGMLTPIASMPRWAQCLTIVNPMRYFMAAIRDVYIKGSGFFDILPQLIPMVVFTVIGWTWAILSYRKNE